VNERNPRLALRGIDAGVRRTIGLDINDKSTYDEGIWGETVLNPSFRLLRIT